jgi:hypothetical protein
MRKSIGVLPKRRGRPPTGRDPLLNFRSPPELTARVDAWAFAQPDQPSRSEALRKLVESALSKFAAGSVQTDASLDHQIAAQKAVIAEMPERSESSPEAAIATMDKALAEKVLIDLKNKRTRRKIAKRK